MNPVINEERMPKFLKAKKELENRAFNKYLLHPWKQGEVVKVAPIEEQVSHPDVNSTPEEFRKRYLVVYRRDAQGNWALKYTAARQDFELLTKKK